jgi:ribosomal protein L35AE/L33A
MQSVTIQLITFREVNSTRPARELRERVFYWKGTAGETISLQIILIHGRQKNSLGVEQ